MRHWLPLLLVCAAALAATAPDLAPPAEQFRRSCERSLLSGLKRSPRVISWREYDVVGRLAKDKRIKAIVYLDKSGEVRWASKPELWSAKYGEAAPKLGFSAEAVEQALQAKAAVVVPSGKKLFEAALPLVSEGQVQGLVDIRADARGITGLGADAARTLKRDAPIRAAAARTAPPKSADSQRQAEQHLLSGIVYYQKGDSAKAREEWQLAEKLDPGNPEPAAGLKRLK